MTIIKHKILLLLIFIQMGSNPSLSYIQQKLKNNETNIALKLISKIDLKKLDNKDLAQYYHLNAQINSKLNREENAYQYYLSAKKQYLKLDSIDKAMDINLDIAYLINAQENHKDNGEKYLNEYINYAKKTKDSLKLAIGYERIASFKIDTGQYNQSLEYFKKAQAYNKSINDQELNSRINTNLANLYNEELDKPDSALYYLKKDIPYLKKLNNPDEFYYNYMNQAASYNYKGNYKKAIEYLKKADSLPLKNYTVKAKQYIYGAYSVNYKDLKDYPNAYKYLLLNKKFADSVNVTEQNVAISDIQTKYQTAEKELENTVLKGNIKTNRILLYTFTGLLIASIIIAFLVYKNAKRREKISLQEKLIEQQKLEKALKDYELHSIDLMLEGQEKERQRIANDLHDNLGSMLATLKINFENLRLRKNELKDEENKLYDRTDELIEEAYQKVRRLAHAKNAGVFASEGLIPTIKKLAEKISIPGKLQIQVIPFGFNDRLESTLEIAIFRAVQELSTNIIKHSQATEATIHLTNHEDNINIIIEDNGIGFDSTKISTADGMGLQTIQKKIAQLGGTLIIDATPGKGTTIIIDIPV